MDNKSNPTNITIGLVRLSYAHLFEPTSMKEGDPAKYSSSIIIPKTDKATIAKVNAAIDAAKALGKDTKYGGKMTGLKLPLRDGDEERGDQDEYVGGLFLNANSNQMPGIVDIHRNKIIDPTQVYSGCYGYVNVTFYPYNFNGTRGVAVGLNHFMKTKDGEPLSGGIGVDEAFEGIDIDDDASDLL